MDEKMEASLGFLRGKILKSDTSYIFGRLKECGFDRDDAIKLMSEWAEEYWRDDER